MSYFKETVLKRRMERFCAKCTWCGRGYGGNTYPGCVEVGADCGWFFTCEGPDGCLAEFKRLTTEE